MKTKPVLVFAALCVLGSAIACSSTVQSVPTPVPTIEPNFIVLTKSLAAVPLPAVDGIGVTTYVAGKGDVVISDSNKRFGDSPPIQQIRLRGGVVVRSIVYARITAVNGSAKLTFVPGFKLVFGSPPAGTLRLAVLADGTWVTAGAPGVFSGKTVTFAALRVKPPVLLANGNSYDLVVYSGSIVPASPTPSPTPSPSPSPSPTPSPSPSPSPSPGVMRVSVACAQQTDACANGTTAIAGSIQFTAIGNTAVLKPSEQGPSTTFKLASDTCNKTDDPSAGGNWATFSPAAGHTGSSFTVKAANAGVTGNPATCLAVLADASGQRVTIDVQVTLGSVGINGRHGRP